MKISEETRYELDKIIDMAAAVINNSDHYVRVMICSYGIDIYAMIGKYEKNKPWLISKTFMRGISGEDADEIIGILTALVYDANEKKASGSQERMER